ncbi:anti-sigma factor [Limnochorda pilosa]|uniref:Zinc-finger domain-containing protein n=1 Tax=Limnochorda pilosa TaxID=1555112 RepID=A0A0K2SND2_LIMPI|nr:hypothetical protein [Limnochorda pilosa]BAS28512.1 hypothetical protein LIP_2682 [Limnochorda pilosa]
MKERCREVQERLLELSPAELASRPDLARHLEACPECRDFWGEWEHLGSALQAADLAEPVDRGRIALAMARADARANERREGDEGRRPLSRDLVPSLLLGTAILGLQVGCWSFWGLVGLAGLQAVSALLLPLAVLGAGRSDFGRAGGEDA